MFCGAKGCEDSTVQHASDCPNETGVFPVTLKDMWPSGPIRCCRCKDVFWPGDRYMHLPVDELPDIYEVVCVGCLTQVEALEAVP